MRIWITIETTSEEVRENNITINQLYDLALTYIISGKECTFKMALQREEKQ